MSQFTKILILQNRGGWCILRTTGEVIVPKFKIWLHFLKLGMSSSTDLTMTPFNFLEKLRWGGEKAQRPWILCLQGGSERGVSPSEINTICYLIQPLSGLFSHFWKNKKTHIFLNIMNNGLRFLKTPLPFLPQFKSSCFKASILHVDWRLKRL